MVNGAVGWSADEVLHGIYPETQTLKPKPATPAVAKPSEPPPAPVRSATVTQAAPPFRNLPDFSPGGTRYIGNPQSFLDAFKSLLAGTKEKPKTDAGAPSTATSTPSTSTTTISSAPKPAVDGRRFAPVPVEFQKATPNGPKP